MQVTYGMQGHCEQRWASTLANRLNARHRSNIQSVGICVARRGRKRFIASLGQDVTYLSLHPMPPPPPQGIGQRSKFVILPTSDGERETLGYEDNTRIFNVTKTMLNHLLRLSTLTDIPDYQKLVKTSQAEGCNRLAVNNLAVLS
jgi:hypothetical protein